MPSVVPNKKNLREIADYGVRVARPGYDAYSCAQNQLLFNSGWPILQIVEVMDVSTMTSASELKLTVYEERLDLTDFSETTSTSTTVVDEVPAGYTSTSSYYEDVGSDIRELLSVNKKYVKRVVSGTVTVYNYPEQITREGNIQITTRTTCYNMPIAKKRHNMGFTPMFLASEWISDVSGYVVLLSVDIATDVDYPYTEKSLQLLKPTTDYGLKSSSKFGSKVPGLCSDMFSKLVQAVKTEKTSKGGGGNIISVWSPVENSSKAKADTLLPYEFYAYISDSSSNAGIDGGAYYRYNYPMPVEEYGAGYAWAVASNGFQDITTTKNSLVVLRSPMVSPEYEEREI